MNIPKTGKETPASEKDKLRNFDLSVDEIRLEKSINEMTSSLKKIEKLDPQSPRAKIIRVEIQKLEDRLDELRDNTLIR